MKTRRILSALLVALMILPMAIMGISAEESTPATPAPGTVLYENNYSTGVNWKLVSGGEETYALLIKNRAENDDYVELTRLDTVSWGRTTLEIVSAEKLAASVVDGKYSIAFDVKWTNVTDNCYIYFGGNDSTTHLSGNILYINTGKNVYLSDHAGGMAQSSSTPLIADAFNTIRLDVEIGATDATVDLYLNETLVVEDWATNSNNLGAIGVSLGKGTGTRNGCSEIALDNVAVTSGETTIYSEDFNGLGTENVIPGYKQGRTDGASRGQGVVANNGGMFFFNGMHNNSARWNEQWLIPDGYLGNATKYTISFDLFNPAIVASSSGTIYMVFGYGDGVSSLSSTAGAWAKIAIGGATNLSLCHDYSADNVEMGATNDYRYSNALVHVILEVDLDADVVVFTITDQEGAVLGTVTNTNMASLVAGGGLRIGCDYAPMYFVDNLRVVAGTAADAPADYYGAQPALNTNGIRFVGTLGQEYTAENIETLREVGFHITATYEGGTKEFNEPCTVLLNTLTGGNETYTAADLGGEHIFAFTIRNIPADAGVITFVVTPYFRTGVVESTGTSWTVVYDAATNTVISQTMNK